ncbi:mRNA 3' end processing factor [Rhizophlyctis rosea]|nr:mRNA 3' end processing factor [Rhizophlyctis rosea]
MRSKERKAKVGKHLDWHFRMNRRAKERKGQCIGREWSLKEEKWVVEREGMSGFGEGKEAVSNIPAENEKEPLCAVRQEALEKFYDDEREEWMLNGFVKVDGG